jgi:NodT family efflux transporter outer membrane factor (OMF) lipoprotein
MSRRAVVLAASLLAAGCTVGPDFHRPAAPTDVRYTQEPVSATAVADGKSQRFVEGGGVAADWWRMLRCPAMDAMITHAIEVNPTLEGARATLRRNQDSLRAGYGVFFPQLDAHAGASRQLYNPSANGLPFPSNTFNLFSLSGTVSYAVDIWGGERRQVEQLRAAVDAQWYALAAADVMIASNVADAVIAQAAYRAEVDATEATLVVLREQERITRAQAEAGTVPYSNVLSVQSQLASTEAIIPALEDKADQASHLLAALLGTTSASWQPPRVALEDLQLPEDLPLTVPSQLVRQRPDILVSEAQLHAANAGIGIATAAMLPNLTLSASYGFGNTSPGNLLDASSTLWSLGAGLTQPVFHGGTLYYQRKAAVEARNAAAAQYQQTVLAAFEQVADTLRGLEHDAEVLAAQRVAVETAEKAVRLLEANYQAGIATYLQVLAADSQYLQARIAYVEAVAQRLQDTVALYVALGGGWWNAPLSSGGT